VLGLFSSFCGIFVVTAAIGIEDSGGLLWFANGLLLSHLLVAPRWRWKHHFAVGFFAMFSGGIAIHPGRWRTCLALTLLNLLEVAIAAFLLRRRSTELPHFTDQRYILRFAAIAVLAAPGAVSILFAFIYSRWMNVHPWHAMFTWITTDGLGNCVVVPPCVALCHFRLKIPSHRRTRWLFPLFNVAVIVSAFCQTRVPIIFLVYPIVASVLLRFGLGWASLNTLLIAVVGGWFTIHGEGPFALMAASTPNGSTVLLQLYVACGMLMLYAAASVIDKLHATERRLREIVSLHDLVTENSRDVIILSDFDGNRNYVSASASLWGGWRREELMGMKSLALVHPEDYERAEAMVRNLRTGGDGGLLECRVKNKAGEFVWVEANLRPVRDPTTGAAIGILNMVRDIARRKKAELELKDLNIALEALVITDPMTGVANRRRFDQCLANEWRRGMRDRLPLSLLVLDVDWFKSFNDTYGHPRGDSCLKQIAEAALDSVNRPNDLVARIGGEEFAVILPNTHDAGAVAVAQQICAGVRHRQMPHAANPMGCVTISIGCATVIPDLGQHSTILVRSADEALYAAKHAGRNQVRAAVKSAREIPALTAD
jgi:diguanylate cyclase (GGDEF)-like protein/PAS domain S-box-containing protein